MIWITISILHKGSLPVFRMLAQQCSHTLAHRASNQTRNKSLRIANRITHKISGLFCHLVVKICARAPKPSSSHVCEFKCMPKTLARASRSLGRIGLLFVQISCESSHARITNTVWRFGGAWPDECAWLGIYIWYRSGVCLLLCDDKLYAIHCSDPVQTFILYLVRVCVL